MKKAAYILSLVILIAILTVSVCSLEPTYNMSQQYRAEKYYENFSKLELSGDGASDVIAVALSQLGYHEGNDDSDLSGLNTSGYKDFVEYNVLKGKLDNNQGNGVSYGYYWCASFVNWCLRQARIPVNDTAAAEISCRRWLAAATNSGIYMGKEGYSPRSADLIFFNDDGSEVTSTHMGIVLYSTSTHVYTIEGNTSNGSEFSKNGNYVAIKSYPLSSSYIVGYATPTYAVDESVPLVDYSGKNMTAGLYVSECEISCYQSSQLTGSKYIIPSHSVFEVVEVDGSSGKIKLDSDGQVLFVWAEIKGKARQLTAFEDSLSVSFIDDNGSLIFSKIYANSGETVQIPLENPKGEKRGFVGWSKSQIDQTDLFFAGDSVLLGKESIKLYAVWDYNFYLISFKAPDGSIIEQKYGYFGDTFDIPYPKDIPDGYLFDGWDTEDIPTLITHDASYTAVYKKREDTETDKTDSSELTGESNAEESDEANSQSGSLNELGGCKSALASREIFSLIFALSLTALIKKKADT